IPCSPRAAIRLMAQTTSCWLPQMELVVPKRMSGLTGSSGLRETAAEMVDGATRLAAAVMPDNASAEETNSRLFVLRSVIRKDMGIPPYWFSRYFAHISLRNGSPWQCLPGAEFALLLDRRAFGGPLRHR